MPTHAMRITLLESTRRTTLRHVAQLVLSVSAQASCVLALTLVWAYAHQQPRQQLSGNPSFLAPFVRPIVHSAPEHVNFIGLGGQPVAPVPHTLAANVDELLNPVPAPRIGGDIASEPVVAAPEVIRVLSEVEVDSVAERDPTSIGPVYPAHLLAKGVQGGVIAQFVVDTTGRPDISSFHVMAPSDTAFVDAVRDALLHMKFRPAKLAGRPVRQLVEQNFLFRIQKSGDAMLLSSLRGATE